MNAYQQPENKLTYNFLCLIKHMPNNKEFIEFLTDGKFSLLQQKPVCVKGVFVGYESNPDGKFSFSTHDDQNINIYFENKTFRLGLTKEQILRHNEKFCRDNNSFLLVVTPKITDKSIIEDCIKDAGSKFFFKTWNEIAQQLHKIEESNPSFVVSQFLEYGKLSKEFMNMQPTNDDVNIYIYSLINKIEEKIIGSLKNIHIDSLFKKSINIKRRKNINDDNIDWGRVGYEYDFKNAYKMWFFYGIYFDDDDHGIKFKKKSESEIAFFFDIDPEKRDELKENSSLKSIFDGFKKQGIEENLFNDMTSNKWRLLAYRIPISEFGEFSTSNLTDNLEKILNIVFSEEFVKIITKS
ncbi:hypothetical protein H6G54_14600 [Anabaena cylindrica FACHB-243]|uniref:Uncharacterized protein n=2 Tax=Anabaena TaxID=1163 RepID=K9ZNK0_ANACC|nr:MULTISPECIES: hypothetical protein [Anabaena]AFZ60369.1 hypothetical protein Anacy_5029 [Anabaena cylindrica PCC 7122]MBD2418908.1 hypothetical protein [Anabaena cylindrica FACHB-243]MBY5284870.1 hypothetical protein [Anabaena sp. CCAP 1446/1C]MBY5309477.1 hypothetical protein [Anabaena sp. CCAP 1446/1C]MCM2404497.1 hypothetical protein [Anabaena sp. CCAP 1446/1C]